MENMTMEIKDGKLIITCDLNTDLGLSKSGKTRIIASSRGNAKVPGTDATIGLNLYRKV
jgi:hypothetical protein